MAPLLLVMAVLAAAPAPAPKQVKLAAPGLSGVGLQPEYIAYFSEQLADALTHEGLRVITAKEISSLLGFERQKSLIGCATETTGSCMAELGNALGVDGLVLGDVAKLGRTYSLSVKIVNAADGERIANYSGKAGSEEAVLELINAAGRQISEILRKRYAGKAAPFEPIASAPSGPPPPLQGISWIPAAGAVVLGGAAVAMYSGAAGAVTELRTSVNIGEARAKEIHFQGKLLEGGAWVAGGLGLAALGTAAWMFFAPETSAPLVLPAATDKSGGVSLFWRWP